MTTDERGIIDELGALLDVEPSAAFAANVRNAIDRASPRRFSWRLVTFAGLGVAVAGAVLAVTVRHHEPVVVPVAHVASSTSKPSSETPNVSAQTHPATGEPRQMKSRPRTAPVAEAVVDLAPIVTSMDGIDVIVPADQRLALARLVRGIRGGRATVPEGLLPKYGKDGLLLPIAPVVISAIPDPATVDTNDIDGGSKRPPKENR
jgi:hypothetical protein